MNSFIFSAINFLTVLAPIKILCHIGNIFSISDCFWYLFSRIDPKVNGIPEDADIEKRKIAKILLDQFNEFSSVVFLLNNGDVYFDEPFERQLNLTATNFSFRDYYQVVEETKKTYLSDAIISKSSGRSLAVIATPVINKENDMIGILHGTINFNNYDKFLQSLNLQNNSRLVLIDKTGVKIGDSTENET
ncbi:MAG: hypothetical protein K0S93_890, partial [Nitrososphaeraceae archaeon]|nr:hypothetical protein [Nitrososphaeraceae archaeon]